MPDRPPRLRPISPDVVAERASGEQPISDAELVARLTEALAALPPTERAAAVVAFGLDAGVAGVAEELAISEADALATTRSALQLLRGALADVDLDEGEAYARLRKHRPTGPPAEH